MAFSNDSLIWKTHGHRCSDIQEDINLVLSHIRAAQGDERHNDEILAKGGYGINLQHLCWHVLMTEPPPSEAASAQAGGRARERRCGG